MSSINNSCIQTDEHEHLPSEREPGRDCEKVEESNTMTQRNDSFSTNRMNDLQQVKEHNTKKL